MNSDIRDIAKWAELNGWDVKDDSKGYSRFYDPEGNFVTYYPATPSNPYRRLKDLKTDLKRAGLQNPAAVQEGTAIAKEERRVSTWAVTMTLRGSPSESTLIELDENLPWEGSVSSIPTREQFAVTAMIEAPEYGKATDVVAPGILDLLSRAGLHPDVIGVETLEQDEYDRRADEPTMPDLVSAPEVAQMLDISRQRVHQLLADNLRFPEPILRLGSGPLWVAAAINKFNSRWDRKPGRPPINRERCA